MKNTVLERKKQILVAILVVCMMSGLTGCRPSPVLEQKMYVEDQETTTDDDAKMNDNQKENTDQDENLSSRQEEEQSRTEREQEKSAPVQGEGNADQPTENQKPQPNSTGTGTAPTGQGVSPTGTPGGDGASQGTGDGQGDGSGSGDGTGTGTPADNAGGGDGLSGSGEGNTDIAEPDPTPNEEPPADVVDDSGEKKDPPEEVGDKVAAVGEAALMVQMLGGSGRLAASSASFTENEIARQVFADEGIDTVETLWTGSGATPLDDSAFARLLELHPSAVFYASGAGVAIQTFTSDQLARLQSEGIQTIALRKFSSPDYIRENAQVIGSALGDKSSEGGLNAVQNASDFCSWYDGILSKVDRACSRFNYNDIDFSQDRYANRADNTKGTETDQGLYTLLLTGWDAGAVYEVASDSSVFLNGSGSGVSSIGYSASPISYYMSEAGVVNTAATGNDMFRLRSWYINPLDTTDNMVKAIQGSQASNPISKDAQFTEIADPATAGRVHLGEERFPAVVATNQAVRRALEADRNKTSGGLWTVYTEVSTGDGKTSKFGFPTSAGGIIGTSIRGNYDVYVLPGGAGDWSLGTPESCLAAMWTAMKFGGAFTEADLEQEIRDFYSKFYRCDLDGNQIATILNGYD